MCCYLVQVLPESRFWCRISIQFNYENLYRKSPRPPACYRANALRLLALLRRPKVADGSVRLQLLTAAPTNAPFIAHRARSQPHSGNPSAAGSKYNLITRKISPSQKERRDFLARRTEKDIIINYFSTVSISALLITFEVYEFSPSLPL